MGNSDTDVNKSYCDLMLALTPVDPRIDRELVSLGFIGELFIGESYPL